MTSKSQTDRRDWRAQEKLLLQNAVEPIVCLQLFMIMPVIRRLLMSLIAILKNYSKQLQKVRLSPSRLTRKTSLKFLSKIINMIL